MKSINPFLLVLSIFAFMQTPLLGQANSDPLVYKVEGDSVTVVGCNKSVSGEVTIPETHMGKPVTAIGERAFIRCNALTGVVIPDSVITVGRGAFQQCAGLRDVTIGKRVTQMGGWVFSGCSSLTSVTIPDNVSASGTISSTGVRHWNAWSLVMGLPPSPGRLLVVARDWPA